jgi:GNAT superfamily N-acetyltransferase
MSIAVRSFTGGAAAAFTEDLARLRIRVFRDFPYLYDGHMEYEESYLRTFLEAPDSILVIAFDGADVVGASSGLPLAAETPNLQAPLLENGFDIDRVFYYGESVLEKAYRGRGLGVRFFKERERWVRSLERFDWLTFCGVIRPDDHPRRPPGYLPLDTFWRNRGFFPTEMTGYISWQDLGEPRETAKPLRFWLKNIRES